MSGVGVVVCHCDPVLDAGVGSLVAENAAGSLGKAAGGVASGGNFPIVFLTAVAALRGDGDRNRVGVGPALLVGHGQLELQRCACRHVRRQGESGPNRFGSDPRALDAPEPPNMRRGP